MRAGHGRTLGLVLLLSLLGAPPHASGAPQERLMREEGDFTIPRGRVVEADLVVDRGTLRVEGELRGSAVVGYGDAIIRGRVLGPVIALYGDVVVEDDGLIEGDAVSVAGEVVLRGRGRVTGANITTTSRGLQRQPEDIEWARIARRSGLYGSDEPLPERPGRTGRQNDWPPRGYQRWHGYASTAEFPLGGFVYNRVDGFTLQGELLGSRNDWGGAGTYFYGGAGYAFTSKRFYFRLGLSRYFVPSAPIELGVSLYKQMETRDDWYLTLNENDLMALLARFDWFDYYLREGVGGYLQFRPFPWVTVGARYSQDREDAVIRSTNWSFFGGDRVFRENEYLTVWDPDESLRVYRPADAGEIDRLTYYLGLRTDRYGGARPSRGIMLDASFEQAGDSPVSRGGDFVYKRVIMQLRAYQRLSPADHLALRVRAGAALGQGGSLAAIPVQHRFYLGGIGSLRGYDFKQFTGDRLFLATLEYTIGGGWASFLDDWALAVFYDWGSAWTAAPGAGLGDELIPEEAKRAYGLAVMPGWFGDMRIEIARPLDADDASFRYYLRWAFSF